MRSRLRDWRRKSICKTAIVTAGVMSLDTTDLQASLVRHRVTRMEWLLISTPQQMRKVQFLNWIVELFASSVNGGLHGVAISGRRMACILNMSVSLVTRLAIHRVIARTRLQFPPPPFPSLGQQRRRHPPPAPRLQQQRLVPPHPYQ